MIELVVEGGHQLGLVQGLREIWAFREVAWAFAERYVRLKYKQAGLGIEAADGERPARERTGLRDGEARIGGRERGVFASTCPRDLEVGA